MLLMLQLLEAHLRDTSIGYVGAPALAIKTDGEVLSYNPLVLEASARAASISS